MGNTATITVKVKKQKIGKGSRKIGRNKVKCSLYRVMGKREKNKARKIRKDAKFKAKKAAEKLKRAERMYG